MDAEIFKLCVGCNNVMFQIIISIDQMQMDQLLLWGRGAVM